MILTHGANSLPRSGGGLIRLPYTLDIARFDTENLTDGKLQWSYTGLKPVVTKQNGELLIESRSTLQSIMDFRNDQFDFDFSRKIKFETTYTQVGTTSSLIYYGPIGCQIISGTNGYFTIRGLWCFKVRSYTTYSCNYQYRDSYYNCTRFHKAPAAIPVKVTHIFDLREPGNFSCEVFFNDTLVVKLVFDTDDDLNILNFSINNDNSYILCGLAGLNISYES